MIIMKTNLRNIKKSKKILKKVKSEREKEKQKILMSTIYNASYQLLDQ